MRFRTGFQVQVKISSAVWWTVKEVDGVAASARIAEETAEDERRDVRVVSREGKVTHKIVAVK